ncbi:hypothetical protein QOT17_003040 [Balamuthia mandrillaris]
MVPIHCKLDRQTVPVYSGFLRRCAFFRNLMDDLQPQQGDQQHLSLPFRSLDFQCFASWIENERLPSPSSSSIESLQAVLHIADFVDYDTFLLHSSKSEQVLSVLQQLVLPVLNHFRSRGENKEEGKSLVEEKIRESMMMGEESRPFEQVILRSFCQFLRHASQQGLDWSSPLYLLRHLEEYHDYVALSNEVEAEEEEAKAWPVPQGWMLPITRRGTKQASSWSDVERLVRWALLEVVGKKGPIFLETGIYEHGDESGETREFVEAQRDVIVFGGRGMTLPIDEHEVVEGLRKVTLSPIRPGRTYVYEGLRRVADDRWQLLWGS